VSPDSRILVTGADGFIGSHLVEALVRAGRQVRAFVLYNALGSWGWLDHVGEDVRSSIEVYPGDVRDAECVRAAMNGCTAVAHLAALIAIPYSYRAPRSYVDTNVVGTINILEAARSCGVGRIVHTSTSEVYGTARFVPITEDHPLQAQSPYAATKIAADQLALSFHRSFGTPVVVVRPFNTYGPRQSARAVIPTIILQTHRDNPEIRLGSLSPTRDFSYVADVARGFMAALDADGVEGQIINLGSNFEIPIAQVVRMVGEIMGREPSVVLENERVRPADSEVERLWADCGRAATMLGWKPNYGGAEGFRRGLGETIAWFADARRRALYKADLYNI
jgi:dTDP-glucose 4,6-dehydratase